MSRKHDFLFWWKMKTYYEIMKVVIITQNLKQRRWFTVWNERFVKSLNEPSNKEKQN